MSTALSKQEKSIANNNMKTGFLKRLDNYLCQFLVSSYPYGSMNSRERLSDILFEIKKNNLTLDELFTIDIQISMCPRTTILKQIVSELQLKAPYTIQGVVEHIDRFIPEANTINLLRQLIKAEIEIKNNTKQIFDKISSAATKNNNVTEDKQESPKRKRTRSFLDALSLFVALYKLISYYLSCASYNRYAFNNSYQSVPEGEQPEQEGPNYQL